MEKYRLIQRSRISDDEGVYVELPDGGERSQFISKPETVQAYLVVGGNRETRNIDRMNSVKTTRAIQLSTLNDGKSIVEEERRAVQRSTIIGRQSSNAIEANLKTSNVVDHPNNWEEGAEGGYPIAVGIEIRSSSKDRDYVESQKNEATSKTGYGNGERGYEIPEYKGDYDSNGYHIDEYKSVYES